MNGSSPERATPCGYYAAAQNGTWKTVVLTVVAVTTTVILCFPSGCTGMAYVYLQ